MRSGIDTRMARILSLVALSSLATLLAATGARRAEAQRDALDARQVAALVQSFYDQTSALSADSGGGCDMKARPIHSPTPVLAPSQSRVTDSSTSIQPIKRCQRIKRAPTSTRTSNGTGGNNSAASTGFHDSMPIV